MRILQIGLGLGSAVFVACGSIPFENLPTASPNADTKAHQEEDPPTTQVLERGPGCQDSPSIPADHPTLERVIAQWDVVPYQNIQTVYNIGVVAFFSEGIDRVDFTLNCGPPTSVRSMQLNPQTNVVEYFAQLDPHRMNDGEVEIRAIAYPQGEGIPKVLPPVFLNANAHQSFVSATRYVSGEGSDTEGSGSYNSPFRSLQKALNDLKEMGLTEGASIFLNNGTYEFGNVNITSDNHWLTLERDPRATQMPIIQATANQALRAKLARLKGIRITTTTITPFIANYSSSGEHLWLDQSVLEGSSPQVGPLTGWHMNYSAIYATGVTIRNARDGLSGSCSHQLQDASCDEFTYVMQRDVTVDHIGSDAFSNSALVINSRAQNIVGGGTLHPDVYQFYGRSGDVILYGLEAQTNLSASQGLFAGQNIGIRDVAFVNCILNNTDNLSPDHWVGRVFQFLGPTRNLYVLNSFFKGPVTLSGAFAADDVVFENSVFVNPSLEPQWPDIEYRSIQRIAP